MDFKIRLFRDGKDYPSKYMDGKHELYIHRVKAMEEKYNVSLPKIKEVFIGDEEHPFNEIHFEDGLRLYDEEATPYLPLHIDNKKRINDWLTSDKTQKYGDFD